MSTGNFKNTNNFGLGILAAIPDESERENDFYFDDLQTGVDSFCNDKLDFLKLFGVVARFSNGETIYKKI